MKKYFERKLVLLILLFYLTFKSVIVLKNALLKYYNYSFFNITWSTFFVEQLVIDTISALIITFVILYITKLMIDRGFSWVKTAIIHVALSIIVVLTSSSIYYLTLYLFGNPKFTFSISKMIHGTLLYTSTSFLFYFTNVLIIYMYSYVKKFNQSELQNAKINHQLVKTQINVLKYQIHPHFLFNTLNSISSLIETNSKLAQNTIADFGDLLRDLLDLKDTSLITLEEELNICKKYLDIMTLRFSDHLKINVFIEKNIEQVLVPSLILLPIIENSIKHGYSYDKTSLSVEISVTTLKNKVIFNIKNDGAPLKKNYKLKGQGLQNTINRLNILYDSNYKYTMAMSKNNKYVVTKIIIPKELNFDYKTI